MDYGDLAQSARFVPGGEAGDNPSVASRRIQSFVASVLGIRRTTVTLIAQTLQADGVIHYRRGKISVLDQARLRSTACECCNSLVRRHWPSTRLLAATIASRPQ